jgi:hypothetical protein
MQPENDLRRRNPMNAGSIALPRDRIGSRSRAMLPVAFRFSKEQALARLHRPYKENYIWGFCN